MKNLELYSKSKPVTEKFPLGYWYGPEPLIYFENLGVGVGEGPNSRRSYIERIVVFPQVIKEAIPYLGVKPKATIGSTLKGFFKISRDVLGIKQKELVYFITYNETAKELKIDTGNFYLLVRNIQSFSPKDLTRESHKHSKTNYYNIKDIAELESHIPNFRQLKIDAYVQESPPPVMQEFP